MREKFRRLKGAVGATELLVVIVIVIIVILLVR